ncbi:hypothetical protein ACEPAG_4638 [Sanghuangporus baumii]
MSPTIAVVAAGEMGAALGARLVSVGRCTVYTVLAGRSQATIDRAQKAGLLDIPLADLPARAEWVLSVLPPIDAHSFAKLFLQARSQTTSEIATRVFVDCNAVSPATVRNISSLFSGTGVSFLDACIIGGPPSEDYDPTIYASADATDEKHLDAFERFNELGLKIKALRGESSDESGGIGDASALKMSYAGIAKGVTGLLSTMILSAHAASPRTASALLNELSLSQPMLLKRAGTGIPPMISKAYRWVGEMEEIADFVDSGLVSSPSSSSHADGSAKESGVEKGEGGKTPGEIYRGLAALYALVDGELSRSGREAGDVRTLLDLAGEAKRISDSKSIPK